MPKHVVRVAVALALTLGGLAAGCAGTTPPAPREPAPDTPVGSPASPGVPGASDPGPGGTAPGFPCPVDQFVAAGKCFTDLGSACTAISCPTDRCRALETGPAQVRCE